MSRKKVLNKVLSVTLSFLLVLSCMSVALLFIDFTTANAKSEPETNIFDISDGNITIAPVTTAAPVSAAAPVSTAAPVTRAAPVRPPVNAAAPVAPY